MRVCLHPYEVGLLKLRVLDLVLSPALSLACDTGAVATPGLLLPPLESSSCQSMLSWSVGDKGWGDWEMVGARRPNTFTFIPSNLFFPQEICHTLFPTFYNNGVK